MVGSVGSTRAESGLKVVDAADDQIAATIGQ